MQLTEFTSLAPHSKTSARLASVAITAGEPAEISNEFEQFDFNEHLTNGSDGVYFVRVVGDSMETEIFHGDLLVVIETCRHRTATRSSPRLTAISP